MEIKEWLLEQQHVLDGLIASAGQRFVDSNALRANLAFDSRTCSQEMWGLSRDGDLCYDRPSIGFCYSLWYHATRVSALVGIFEEVLTKGAAEKQINIYDLGAGTGAVQWAVALIYVCLKRLGKPVPAIRLVNIDSSPFMLNYNQHYLWAEFVRTYPEARSIVSEYSINNWTNNIDEVQENKWICASYVFDHHENREELANEFARLVKNVRPTFVLLFTSTQIIQKEYVAHVTRNVVSAGYDEQIKTLNPFYFRGPLKEVVALRQKLQSQIDYGFSGDPTWDQNKLHSVLLSIRQQELLPTKVETIKMYYGPEVNRKKVQLTEQQIGASVPTTQPTMIIGPAGCGKSMVLTEKIRQIVEDSAKPYDPTTSILLTTFNKKLVNVLGTWLMDVLDAKKCRREKYRGGMFNNKLLDHSYFVFNGSKTSNIRVLHFDVLPTIIGNIKGKKFRGDGKEYEKYHRDLMATVVDEYFYSKKLNRSDFEKITDPDFLIDEFERVFYGMQIRTRKDYLSIERLGRGYNPTLRYNSQRREIIYDLVHGYFAKMKQEGTENFLLKRNALLKRIKAGKIQPMFTHVLVDELQDCTSADYSIFLGLLKDKNNLTVAGDLAQSIQLGGAFYIPFGDEMKKYKKNKLDGSFRLPFRVSEGIKELSENISSRYGNREGLQAEIIKPYKYAPPGSRPIVVFAKDVGQMADKIAEIVSVYAHFGFSELSVFEKDTELAVELNKRKIITNADKITKSKGLEFPLVVWSSRLLADTKLEQEEFAYTIFTRTSSLLIIAYFENSDIRLKDIVKIFEKNKSVYWDEETLSQMEIVREEQTRVEELDDDRSDEITEIREEGNLDEFIDA